MKDEPRVCAVFGDVVDDVALLICDPEASMDVVIDSSSGYDNNVVPGECVFVGCAVAKVVVSLSGWLEEALMKVAIAASLLIDGVSAVLDSSVEVDVGSV